MSRKRFLTVVSAIYIILFLRPAGGGVALNTYGSGTLEDDAWMATEHLGNALGIAWLQEHVEPSDIVAESTGVSHTYSSRVSAITSLTAPSGWAGHESGWRSGPDSVGTVVSDLEQMYENPGFTLYLKEKYGTTTSLPVNSRRNCIRSRYRRAEFPA